MLQLKKYIIILSGSLVICFMLLNILNEAAMPYFPKYNYPEQKNREENNPFTEQNISIKNGKYYYSYQFRDHKNMVKKWQWYYDRKYIDRVTKIYGVPPSIYEPYKPLPEVVEKRNKIINEGLFRQRDTYVEPDVNKIINTYMPVAAPITKLADRSFSERPTREERVELLMKFIQDIPYAVPPREYDGKYIFGIFPPPVTLNMAWGDCDTKAVLLSSILGHYPEYKMLVIYLQDHVLLAINGIPRTYQKYIEYHGDKYIYCESVGPARLPFGSVESTYLTVKRVIPVVIDPSSRQYDSRLYGIISPEE